MSRIYAVDRILSAEKRIYIEFYRENNRSKLPSKSNINELVTVYKIDLSIQSHFNVYRGLISRSRFVYVHTLNYARYVLPYYSTGKIITDIHGITPEEELLHGNLIHSKYYDQIESRVIQSKNTVVVVTDAMGKYYQSKYPNACCEFMVLPIYEDIMAGTAISLKKNLTGKSPTIVYSGASQRWQNISLMMEVIASKSHIYNFKILSNEPEVFKNIAREKGIYGQVEIDSVAKDELHHHYAQCDYGFVLRDDISVNRVACPTKLIEYLCFGIIPIVTFSNLGDFNDMGYRYITLDDIIHDKLPPLNVRNEMINNNYEVINKLKRKFDRSASALVNLLKKSIHAKDEDICYLTDYERNNIYPALSELHAMAQNGTQSIVCAHKYFVGSCVALHFKLYSNTAISKLLWYPINTKCTIIYNEIIVKSNSGIKSFVFSTNSDLIQNEAYLYCQNLPKVYLDIDESCHEIELLARFDICSYFDNDSVQNVNESKLSIVNRIKRLF